LTDDPLTRLRTWLDEARDAGVAMPEAATLATATADGTPSARTVSVKVIDDRGLAFGTALTGRKAAELAENPRAALTFWWEPVGRQVRVEGVVERAPREEAERVWAARGRENRIATLVSRQGEPLVDRNDLERAYERADAQHGADVPCPEDWGVYRVIPRSVEFWQDDDRRLVARERHSVAADGVWSRQLLQP
jgi:pyridoxamine 5'-phosphate oxidase